MTHSFAAFLSEQLTQQEKRQEKRYRRNRRKGKRVPIRMTGNEWLKKHEERSTLPKYILLGYLKPTRIYTVQ